MSLAEALAQRAEKANRRACKFRRIYDSLDPDDQAELDRRIAGGMDNVSIAAAITDTIEPISDATVGKHLRGICRNGQPCDG